MRVRMTVSLVEMPFFTLREKGTIQQVDEATGAAWVACGLAELVVEPGRRVSGETETASIAGGVEKAVLPRAGRKRG